MLKTTLVFTRPSRLYRVESPSRTLSEGRCTSGPLTTIKYYYEPQCLLVIETTSPKDDFFIYLIMLKSFLLDTQVSPKKG